MKKKSPALQHSQAVTREVSPAPREALPQCNRKAPQLNSGPYRMVFVKSKGYREGYLTRKSPAQSISSLHSPKANAALPQAWGHAAAAHRLQWLPQLQGERRQPAHQAGLHRAEHRKGGPSPAVASYLCTGFY